MDGIMSLHRIHWRNLESGRTGAGTKTFEQSEAEQLAKELNEEHPHIEHIALPADQTKLEPKPPTNIYPLPTAPMADTDLMPFGAYHHTQLRHVPSDYLDFLSSRPELMAAWPALAAYIERARKSINQDLDREERE